MPATVYDGTATGLITAFEFQRKIIRNPRGQQYYYAILNDSATLRILKSKEGVVWAEEWSELQAGSINVSAWPYDDGSQLVIYIAYEDSNQTVIQYRRAVVADAGSTISMGTEQTVKTAGDDSTQYPVITRGKDGYVWVAWREEYTDKGKSRFDIRCKATTTTNPGDAPSWSDEAIIWDGSVEEGAGSYTKVTVAPYSSGTKQVLFVHHSWWTPYYTYSRTATYSGSGAPTLDTEITLNSNIDFNKFSLAIDSNEKAYFVWCFEATLKLRTWDVGEANWSSIVTVYSGSTSSVSIGIDKTSSPDQIYVFYVRPDIETQQFVFYKVADAADIPSFGDEQEVEAGLNEYIANLSCAYEDWNGDSKLQVIWTTQTNYYARFEEVPKPDTWGNDYVATGNVFFILSASTRRTSHRFTAQQSKTVDKIRLSLDPTGTPSTYRIGIQTDSSGLPSGSWVGGNAYADVSSFSEGENVIDITNASLTQGTVYHIVVKWQTGILPDENNNISVRALRTRYIRNRNPYLPYDGAEDTSLDFLFYETSWINYGGTVCIFVLEYTDVSYDGQPYTTGQEYNLNTTTKKVGQKFTVPNNMVISAIEVPIKIGGGTPDSANLQIKIYNVTDSQTVKSDSWSLTGSGGAIHGDYAWVKCIFSSTFILYTGKTYKVYLYEPIGGSSTNYYTLVGGWGIDTTIWKGLNFQGTTGLWVEGTADPPTTEIDDQDFIFRYTYEQLYTAYADRSLLLDITTGVLTGYANRSLSLDIEQTGYLDRNLSLDIEKIGYTDRDLTLDINYLGYTDRDLILDIELTDFEDRSLTLEVELTDYEDRNLSLDVELTDYLDRDLLLDINYLGYIDRSLTLEIELTDYLDRDLSLDINYLGYEDRSLSLDTEIPAFEDRNLSLDIEQTGYTDRDLSLDINYLGYADRSLSLDINYLDYLDRSLSLDINYQGFEDRSLSLKVELTDYSDRDLILEVEFIAYVDRDLTLDIDYLGYDDRFLTLEIELTDYVDRSLLLDINYLGFEDRSLTLEVEQTGYTDRDLILDVELPIETGYEDRDFLLDIEQTGYFDRDLTLEVELTGYADRNLSLDINYLDYEDRSLTLDVKLTDYADRSLILEVELTDYLDRDFLLDINFLDYEDRNLILEVELTSYADRDLLLDVELALQTGYEDRSLSLEIAGWGYTDRDFQLEVELTDYTDRNLSLDINYLGYADKSLELEVEIITYEDRSISLDINYLNYEDRSSELEIEKIDYTDRSLILDISYQGFEDRDLTLNIEIISYEDRNLSLDIDYLGYEDRNFSLTVEFIDYADQSLILEIEKIGYLDRSVLLEIEKIGWEDRSLELDLILTDFEDRNLILEIVYFGYEDHSLSMDLILTGLEDRSLILDIEIIYFETAHEDRSCILNIHRRKIKKSTSVKESYKGTIDKESYQGEIIQEGN